jgi:hypothetical protein
MDAHRKNLEALTNNLRQMASDTVVQTATIYQQPEPPFSIYSNLPLIIMSSISASVSRCTSIFGGFVGLL